MRWLATVFAVCLSATIGAAPASAQFWPGGPAYPALVQRPMIVPLVGPQSPNVTGGPASPAWAQSPDLLGTCILATPADGLITPGGDLKSWATTTPATVAVTNTGRAELLVTRPTTWASSPAATPATNFTLAGTMTGVNTGNLLGLGGALSGVLSGLGLTVLSLSLGATASTPFPSGAYVAQVTVTCTVQ